MGLSTDARLLEIGAQHHGLVHLDLTDAAGIPRHAVRTRVARGVLEHLDTSTYRLRGFPASFEQRALRATFTAGAEAMASHRTAALLRGLDGIRSAPVEVLVPRWARCTGRHACLVHESLHLDESDRDSIGPIPVTSVPRTLIDLASVEPPSVVEQVMEDAFRRRLCSVEDVVERFVRLPARGRRGATTVRALLADRTGAYVPTDSDFELRVLHLLEDAGIPSPVRQFEVDILGGRTVRLDLAWPEVLVAVECDGVYHHGTTIALRWDDRRQNQLVLEGWLVLRFTWDDLTTRPEEVVAVVRSALRTRGLRL